jgi:hypothetical protein
MIWPFPCAFIATGAVTEMSEHKVKRALITGGTGYLGKHAVTAFGEIDGVGPKRGTTTLTHYFESPHAANSKNR